MDQEVSITLTGSAERISAVLEFWRGSDGAGTPQAPPRAEPPAGPGSLADLDKESLALFVQRLSEPARAVVYRIAVDASRGLRMPVGELVDLEGVSSLPELNGFMGGVGRVWGRLFPIPNPFVRGVDSAIGESFYELDLEFARRLVAAFDDSSRRFERWTERVRKSFTLAHEEAEALSHGAVGTEHLLLGLLREGEGRAAQALAMSGVGLEAAREQVRALSPHHGPAPHGELGLSPRLRAMIVEHVIPIARRMKDAHVRQEHLLLGLLDAGDSTAGEVLSALHASADSLRGPILMRHLVRGTPGHVEDVMTMYARTPEPPEPSPAGELPDPQLIEELTPREHEVLDLIARGHANNDIAETLSISVMTVNAHQGRIYKKLGVSVRSDAIAIALRAGLGD